MSSAQGQRPPGPPRPRVVKVAGPKRDVRQSIVSLASSLSSRARWSVGPADAPPERQAQSHEFRVTPITGVFEDPEIEAAYLENVLVQRGGARTIARILIGAAAVFGVIFFNTVFVAELPTTLQKVSSGFAFSQAAIVAGLASRHETWKRLMLARKCVVGQRLVTTSAFLGMLSMISLLMDEYVRNDDVICSPSHRVAEGENVLLWIEIHVLGFLLLILPLSNLTAGAFAAMDCFGTVVVVVMCFFAFRGTATPIAMATALTVFHVVLFVVARSIRVNDRFTFVLLDQLRKENITVKLRVGPYRRPGTSDQDTYRPPWQIDRASLELGDVIGRGGYGEVLRGTWRGTTVAVKRLFSLKGGAFTEFMGEVGLLMDLRHPNIVLLMGVCLQDTGSGEDGSLMMVTEFCDLGSLADLVHSPVGRPISGERRLALLQQAASGMRFLHRSSPPVLHRDLKLANILVDARWTAKIADFGLADQGEQLATEELPMGTLLYMPPEVLTGGAFETGSDVYSFGLCLWEALSAKTPYADFLASGSSLMHLALAITGQGKRPDLQDAVYAPPEVAAVIERLWDPDVSTRPDFDWVVVSLKEVCPEPSLLDFGTINSFVGSGLEDAVRVTAHSKAIRAQAAVRDGAIQAFHSLMQKLKDQFHGWLDEVTIDAVSLEVPDVGAALRVATRLVREDSLGLSIGIGTVSMARVVASAAYEVQLSDSVKEAATDGSAAKDKAALDEAIASGRQEPIPASTQECPIMDAGALELGEARGSDKFGLIVDAMLRGSTAVTCKTLSLGKQPESLMAVVCDVLALARLQRHPHLVRMIGVAQSGMDLYIVTGRTGQTLREAEAPPRRKVELLRQALMGLSHLHERGLVHGEMTPQSIFVSSDLEQAQLGDYGLAATVAHTASLTGLATPAFQAPEVMQGGRRTAKADVFSAGMVLYEVGCGERPHAGRKWLDIYNETRRGMRPLVPGTAPSMVRDAFKAAVEQEPESRPTASELAEMLGDGNRPSGSVRGASMRRGVQPLPALSVG